MHVELYHTIEDLKRTFRREKNPKVSVRIQAVYLALMGKNALEVGIGFGLAWKASSLIDLEWVPKSRWSPAI